MSIDRTPDYLVIGHVAKDLLPSGSGAVAGGTVTYSAILAHRLGLQSAIVTACRPEDDYLLDAAREEGVWVTSRPSPATTTFLNRYDRHGHRQQVLSAQADPVTFGDVPEAWKRSPIVHLGPIARELPPDLTHDFPDALLGVTPQGWMRSWGEDGHVLHSAVPVPEALHDLPKNAILVLSTEDLGGNAGIMADYVNLAPIVVITDGPGEAALHSAERYLVGALSANSVDPTGAGDVFAAALFVRYKETGDLVSSARFAHAAAACNIEGRGVSAVPDRATIVRRLQSAGYGVEA